MCTLALRKKMFEKMNLNNDILIAVFFSLRIRFGIQQVNWYSGNLEYLGQMVFEHRWISLARIVRLELISI